MIIFPLTIKFPNPYNVPMFIGIVGCMGVGKSHLTAALADRLGYRAFFEPVKENPYLDDYYNDPQRYACLMQFFMMTRRFQQHREIQGLRQQDVGIVQDQIIYGDVLYATVNHKLGYMDDRDFDNYRTHFATLEPLLRLPDVIIHLDTSIATVQDRIRMRGRQSEKGIDPAYLQALRDTFSEWVDDAKNKTTVLDLDWNAFRPVDSVVNEIEQAMNVQLPLPSVADAVAV